MKSSNLRAFSSEIDAWRAGSIGQNRSTLQLFSLDATLRSLEDGTFSAPSVKELSSILHKCRRERNVAFAARLHTYMQTNGFENHAVLGNSLVCMLAMVGRMRDAELVLDRQVHQDNSSWNSLIKGYCQCGEIQLALDVYKKSLGNQAIQFTSSTFIELLKACAELKDFDLGSTLHVELARKGSLEADAFLGAAVVDMYVKCGFLAAAQEVFNNLAIRDVVLWTTLITGYVQGERCEDALLLFETMQQEGISPDVFTFACCLKACGIVRAIEKGQQLHTDIVWKGLENDVYAGNVLIDMYSMCGLLEDAQEVFDKLCRDVVSWNTLIAGYLENGHAKKALNRFWQMREEGIDPEAATVVCGLKACGSVEDIDSGQKIHAEIIRESLDKNAYIASTLVDMYIRCGWLAKAQEIFDTLSTRNVVSWTALLTGYADHGQCEKALTCLEQMQKEGISPVTATVISALKACGSMGATDKGLEVHAQAVSKGLEGDSFVAGSLVGMYAKCACILEAQQVSKKLPSTDVVSWTSLIAGYALVGEGESVFHALDCMLEEGMEPNVSTFGHVLNACNHRGLVDKGEMFFEIMLNHFGINPIPEHFSCMVDLLSRGGNFEKAVWVVDHMPFHPSSALWHIMLAACQKWGNVKNGREAFENAIQLDEKDYSAYILMSNIYADANMQEDVDKIEAMKLDTQALDVS